jgi:peptidoglycan/LPS O-acetylase OafA/YrhL
MRPTRVVGTNSPGWNELVPMPLFKPAIAPLPDDVRALTALRFFAAFWVLALHYTDFMPADFAAVTGFFAEGKLGVDFFFVLSGFILTHVYLGRLEQGDFAWQGFMLRRFARLYPLHLATFFVVVAYVTAGRLAGIGFSVPEAYTLEAAWPNLLMLHAWGIQDHMSWNYVSWSISAEWFAYLLFLPLSLLVLRLPFGPGGKLVLAGLGLLVASFVAEQAIGRPLTHLTHDFGILRILPEFVLGITLYHAIRTWDLEARHAGAFLAVTLGGILAIVHWRLDGLWAVVLLAFLIFAVASLARQGRLAWLSGPVPVYLGEISYAIYMTHAIVFIVFFRGLGLLLRDPASPHFWWLGPIALALTLVAAMLAHHLVERPARRWLNRLFAGGFRRPSQAPRIHAAPKAHRGAVF